MKRLCQDNYLFDLNLADTFIFIFLIFFLHMTRIKIFEFIIIGHLHMLCPGHLGIH